MIKESDVDISFYKNMFPDDGNSTHVKFFSNGNTAVVKDSFKGVETVAIINKTTKTNFVAVTSEKGSRTYEFPTGDLRSFLELDFRVGLDQEENPEYIRDFVGEIPIVYGLLG